MSANPPAPSEVVARLREAHQSATDAFYSGDGEAHGRTSRRERHSVSKLRDADVARIRERLDAGDTQRVIAQQYGVSPGCVSHIKTGRTWAR